MYLSSADTKCRSSPPVAAEPAPGTQASSAGTNGESLHILAYQSELTVLNLSLLEQELLRAHHLERAVGKFRRKSDPMDARAYTVVASPVPPVQ